MNMYKARPSSYYMENVTMLSVCLPSAARSYSSCREEYYQEQVGVKLGPTLLSEGRSGMGQCRSYSPTHMVVPPIIEPAALELQ